jgi:transcriptional regulator with XRE-family HTH domain
MWAWLSHDLRFYRLKHNLSGERFGRIIGVVRSTVSKLEHGIPKINEDQARALDEHFQTGGHFFRLLWYARLGHDPDWFKEHIGYEIRAEIIRIFELALIPGLLQTEEYARALFTQAGERNAEDHVATRMRRQEIFDRDRPPFLWVLLDECALRPVADPDVMKAQLARLLELCEQPNVSLRVVPMSAGYHQGLEGSGFIRNLRGNPRLQAGEEVKTLTVEEGDMAYTDATGGGRLIRSTSEVRTFNERYHRIGAKALPEDPSRRLIRQAMEAMT